jgi:hypothetical protein
MTGFYEGDGEQTQPIAHNLDQHTDVVITTPTVDGQVLTYVASSNDWQNKTPDSGGTVINELNDIGDVNAPAPTDLDVLTWSDSGQEWVPASVGAGAPIGMNDLTDVTVTTPLDGNLLEYQSGAWVNIADKYALLDGSADFTGDLTISKAAPVVLSLEDATSSNSIRFFFASGSADPGLGWHDESIPTDYNILTASDTTGEVVLYGPLDAARVNLRTADVNVLSDLTVNGNGTVTTSVVDYDSLTAQAIATKGYVDANAGGGGSFDGGVITNNLTIENAFPALLLDAGTDITLYDIGTGGLPKISWSDDNGVNVYNFLTANDTTNATQIWGPKDGGLVGDLTDIKITLDDTLMTVTTPMSVQGGILVNTVDYSGAPDATVATKKYVDDSVASGGGAFVPLDGSANMTGGLGIEVATEGQNGVFMDSGSNVFAIRGSETLPNISWSTNNGSTYSNVLAYQQSTTTLFLYSNGVAKFAVNPGGATITGLGTMDSLQCNGTANVTSSLTVDGVTTLNDDVTIKGTTTALVLQNGADMTCSVGSVITTSDDITLTGTSAKLNLEGGADMDLESGSVASFNAGSTLQLNGSLDMQVLGTDIDLLSGSAIRLATGADGIFLDDSDVNLTSGKVVADTYEFSNAAGISSISNVTTISAPTGFGIQLWANGTTTENLVLNASGQVLVNPAVSISDANQLVHKAYADALPLALGNGLTGFSVAPVVTSGGLDNSGAVIAELVNYINALEARITALETP